jgi:hypothetical protein
MVLAVAFAGSLIYGVIVGNVWGPMAIWYAVGAGLFKIGLALVVVYLFYRFVLAVETIAEKL